MNSAFIINSTVNVIYVLIFKYVLMNIFPYIKNSVLFGTETKKYEKV